MEEKKCPTCDIIFTSDIVKWNDYNVKTHIISCKNKLDNVKTKKNKKLVSTPNDQQLANFFAKSIIYILYKFNQ